MTSHLLSNGKEVATCEKLVAINLLKRDFWATLQTCASRDTKLLPHYVRRQHVAMKFRMAEAGFCHAKMVGLEEQREDPMACLVHISSTQSGCDFTCGTEHSTGSITACNINWRLGQRESTEPFSERYNIWWSTLCGRSRSRPSQPPKNDAPTLFGLYNRVKGAHSDMEVEAAATKQKMCSRRRPYFGPGENVQSAT